MSYRIEFVRDAAGEVKSLPRHARNQAVELSAALAANPRPARAFELRLAPDIYRIWLASRWRIAYQVDDDEACVYVLRIRDKQEVAFDTVPPWMRDSATWDQAAEANARKR